jgi:3-hydroxyisobutyrate dehydrogenase-like beta-hydroxyacid dehydrogenase
MKEIRTVGIIGLGKMGMPMARLLRERGFTVIGYDVKAASGLGIQPVMPAHERAALRCG